MEVEVDPSLMEFIAQSASAESDSKNADAEAERKDADIEPGFTDEDSDESIAGSQYKSNSKGKVPPRIVLPDDKVDESIGSMDLFQNQTEAASIAEDFAW